MFVLPFESLQQLDYLLNYFGCQQTAICNEGMFSHIMTTDSWCQTGYAFQFVPGNNNNYSSCKSSLHYSMNSFRRAHISQNTQLHARHLRQAAGGMKTRWQTLLWSTFGFEKIQSKPDQTVIQSWNHSGFLVWPRQSNRCCSVLANNPEKVMDLGENMANPGSSGCSVILQLVEEILLLFN